MKRESSARSLRKPEPEFPALRDFFSGYLHQDFLDEYSSAAGAARAFCDEASTAERTAIRAQWDLWRKQLVDTSPDAVAAAIRKLGGAWQPESVSDLDELGRILSEGKG